MMQNRNKTKKPWVVRLMTEKDLEWIYRKFQIVNPTLSPEFVNNWARKCLKDYPDLCFVAQKNEKTPIGALTGYLRWGNIPYVEDLWVEPKFRGRGIGRALIQQLLMSLEKRKAEIVKVEANPAKFSAAIGFYYRLGFRVCGFEQNRFGVGPEADSILLSYSFIKE
ncbi:MAG: GNAT family N-acetyltransferase [Candidatus Hodarchaeota archaeon]